MPILRFQTRSNQRRTIENAPVRFGKFDEESILRHFSMRIQGSSVYFIRILAATQKQESATRGLVEQNRGIIETFSAIRSRDDYQDKVLSQAELNRPKIKMSLEAEQAKLSSLETTLLTSIQEAPLPFVREVYRAIADHESFHPGEFVLSALEARLTSTL